jgi:FKBP-type peptidyl-prolyl cis-trans isomerase 2
MLLATQGDIMAESGNNERKILGIVIIVLILIGGYIGYSMFLKEETVGPNDIVEVNYIAWLQDEGTVFATTIVNEHNVTSETPLDDSHRYRPISFTIGPSEASKGTVKAVPGLEEGLIGMSEGETKIVEVPAEKGYEKDPEDIVEQSRTWATFDKLQTAQLTESVQRTLTINETQYSSTYGKSAEVGDVVRLPSQVGSFLPYFTAEVTEVAQGKVTLTAQAEVGTVIETKPWNYEVTKVTDTNIMLTAQAEVGNEYENAYGTIEVQEITEEEVVFYQVGFKDEIETAYGPAEIQEEDEQFIIFLNPEVGTKVSTQQGTATITEISEDTLTLDYNEPYRGADIVFKVKVESIIQAEN